MTIRMCLAWIFLGIMTYFFYKRLQKTKSVLLVPVYFLLLIVGGLFLISGLGVVIYYIITVL